MYIDISKQLQATTQRCTSERCTFAALITPTANHRCIEHVPHRTRRDARWRRSTSGQAASGRQRFAAVAGLRAKLSPSAQTLTTMTLGKALYQLADQMTGERWRDQRLHEAKSSTVVRELSLMQSAVDHVLGDNADADTNSNPLRHVKRPRVDDRRERRLTDREWKRLLNAAGECLNPLMRPLLVLARETAMRRGELLSMEWRHVDSEGASMQALRDQAGHPTVGWWTCPMYQDGGDAARRVGRCLEAVRKMLRASITSVEFSLRLTRIARHSRLNSSRMFNVWNRAFAAAGPRSGIAREKVGAQPECSLRSRHLQIRP